MSKKQKNKEEFFNFDLASIFSKEQIDILIEMAELKGQTIDEFCNNILKKYIDNNKKIEVDMNKMGKFHIGKEQ
jgi:hypothetical protein